jgi:hypothetical protein
MKRVVDKHTVAHLFANQLQNDARTPGNGNLFFEGDTIYSYGRHFRIAKHVENAAGEKAILLTERTYSVSTSKHVSIVHHALHGNIIKVSTLDEKGYYSSSEATPDTIFKKWCEEGEAIAAKLQNARKPEIYSNQLDGLKHRVEKYSNFFDFEIPSDLQYVLSITTKEQFAGLVAAKEQAAKEETERKLRETHKITDIQIKKFRSFEIGDVHTRGYGFDYLRFNAESNRVETSQRVQIPADIAKRFYKIVLDTIAAGGCTECNQQLLNYQVKEINKKFIVVGCHKIEIKEIKTLTKKLGW